MLAACAVLGTVVGAGCESQTRDRIAVDPPVSFDTAAVVIETARGEVRITVEVADTDHQRAYGLMERTSLPTDHGMLFTYPAPQAPESGFWMYRTLIPLEIMFLDEAGTIVAVEQMDPCESPDPRLCPIYSPGVPYVAALEVNRGFLSRRGVGLGDRVRLVEGGAQTGPGEGEQ
jgi:uncharacterized protein